MRYEFGGSERRTDRGDATKDRKPLALEEAEMTGEHVARRFFEGANARGTPSRRRTPTTTTAGMLQQIGAVPAQAQA